MAAPKSWIEIVLLPIVLAGVGIAGTILVTRQQEKSAERISRAQVESAAQQAKAELESAEKQAEADRQIKILEIFAEKITSREEKERLLAVRLLGALDAELAKSLADAVGRDEPPESAVRRVASEVSSEAESRAANRPRIFIHIRSEEDRRRARQLGQRLEASGFIVPGVERLTDIGPDSAQLRYFRAEDEAGARGIAEQLARVGVRVEPRYTGGYEMRPGHYELWFPTGEPKLE